METSYEKTFTLNIIEETSGKILFQFVRLTEDKVKKLVSICLSNSSLWEEYIEILEEV